ncbi:MAG: FAD-dependent oxidoreductase [Actinomycetes bacterium]
MAIPRDAQVTVVGGGAVGAAALYFLATHGWSDVQLVEAGDLCSATSSQAAGFVGQARPTIDRARLTMASAELYRTFEANTGYSTDYKESGAVRIALSDGSHAELEQIAQTAEVVGLPVEFLSPARLREVYPVLQDISAVRSALWSPTDGYLQPNSLVNAYVQAARDRGATVATQSPVQDLVIKDGRIAGFSTPQGTYATELLVIAAGPWSVALARLAGLDLPIVPVLHEYFVSEPVAGWDSNLPCLRIPEVQVYARGEGGRILCGGFEQQGTSIDPRAVEVDSTLQSTPNWEVLGSFAHGLAKFVPDVEDVAVRSAFHGWPAFTPDGRFIVGPVSSLPGLAFAAGCNAHGVSGSAGLGMHLVESLQPDPSQYVQSLSPDRFIPATWNWDDARRDSQAVYENYYPMPGSAHSH